MGYYKYKCNGCGSSQCIKEGNSYICKYCGTVQEIFEKEEQKQAEQNNEDNTININTKINLKLSDSMKNILIRLIVCIFAGWAGVHKFIERKIFIGVIYIFTGGLFGIGIFIDIIRYIIQLVDENKSSEVK